MRPLGDVKMALALLVAADGGGAFLPPLAPAVATGSLLRPTPAVIAIADTPAANSKLLLVNPSSARLSSKMISL